MCYRMRQREKHVLWNASSLATLDASNVDVATLSSLGRQGDIVDRRRACIGVVVVGIGVTVGVVAGRRARRRRESRRGGTRSRDHRGRCISTMEDMTGLNGTVIFGEGIEVVVGILENHERDQRHTLFVFLFLDRSSSSLARMESFSLSKSMSGPRFSPLHSC